MSQCGISFAEIFEETVRINEPSAASDRLDRPQAIQYSGLSSLSIPLMIEQKKQVMTLGRFIEALKCPGSIRSLFFGWPGLILRPPNIPPLGKNFSSAVPELHYLMQ